jgi:hypothetical protein
MLLSTWTGAAALLLLFGEACAETKLLRMAQATMLPPMRHVPNTYCEYYEQGGDGGCSDGKSFTDVWQKCEEDGSDLCMGVMWNSCQGTTPDTSVNGAWKLMKAGQEIGTAESPTPTCGGKNQAVGHWDVFVRVDHVPNTYCKYYKSGGGDATCTNGRSFFDVWGAECDADGSDVCMGVMWNSCQGPTSDTSVNGAWHLMTAGQEIGTAESPTATCGGRNQALGHWDVFARSPAEITAGSGDPITVTGEGGTITNLNYCEVLRAELIIGCFSLLPALFAFPGCMAAAATAWHICFQNTGRQLVDVIPREVCGDECFMMLSNVDAPEADAYDFTKIAIRK